MGLTVVTNTQREEGRDFVCQISWKRASRPRLRGRYDNVRRAELETKAVIRRAVPRRQQQQHTSLAVWQPCDRDGFRNRVTLTFDLLISGSMRALQPPLRTSVPSLVLIARAVFLSERGHTHTDKESHRRH